MSISSLPPDAAGISFRAPVFPHEENTGMTAFVYIRSFRKLPDRQILVACFPVTFLNGKPEHIRAKYLYAGLIRGFFKFFQFVCA